MTNTNWNERRLCANEACGDELRDHEPMGYDCEEPEYKGKIFCCEGCLEEFIRNESVDELARSNCPSNFTKCKTCGKFFKKNESQAYCSKNCFIDHLEREGFAPWMEEILTCNCEEPVPDLTPNEAEMIICKSCNREMDPNAVIAPRRKV